MDSRRFGCPLLLLKTNWLPLDRFLDGCDGFDEKGIVGISVSGALWLSVPILIRLYYFLAILLHLEYNEYKNINFRSNGSGFGVTM